MPNKKRWLIPALTILGAIAYLIVLTGPDDLPQSTIVPLAFAEARAGDNWSTIQRQAFKNDPINRWPMSSEERRTRGARGPDEWLPPFDQCLYLSRFVTVMKTHGLDANTEEMRRLTTQRQRCYTQFQ